MGLSKQRLRAQPICSLGFVKVATAGTPVALSVNIDANNVNAPGTPTAGPFPNNADEYTPSFRGFQLQGFQPAANNNGMVPNAGYVYLLQAAAGGNGNRTDSGCMLAVLAPGGSVWYPPDGTGRDAFSPYTLYLDADNNNDGALVVAFGGQ